MDRHLSPIVKCYLTAALLIFTCTVLSGYAGVAANAQANDASTSRQNLAAHAPFTGVICFVPPDSDTKAHQQNLSFPNGCPPAAKKYFVVSVNHDGDVPSAHGLQAPAPFESAAE